MKRCVIFAAFGIVAVLACSGKTTSTDSSADASSDPDAAPRDATAPCSTGPTNPNDFVDYVHGEYDPTEYPMCTPHCGYTNPSLSGAYLADALPSGGCTGEGAPCGMLIGITCCGAKSGLTPIRNLMRCDCIDGNWQCVIAIQGAGVCGRCPKPVDASAD